MRPKVVLAILASGSALLLCLFAGRRSDRVNVTAVHNQAAQSSSSGVRTPPLAAQPQRAAETSLANSGGVSPVPGKAGTLSPASSSAASSSTSPSGLTHEELVDQRVSELMDLAMNDDADSLNAIVAELNNADPDIRKGALEAVKQFGSLDAIPRLEEAAARADSAADKRSIEEAIDFLKLPSLTARNK
jgi:hypothetical protein